jgi:hypothetical protein
MSTDANRREDALVFALRVIKLQPQLDVIDLAEQIHKFLTTPTVATDLYSSTKPDPIIPFAPGLKYASGVVPVMRAVPNPRKEVDSPQTYEEAIGIGGQERCTEIENGKQCILTHPHPLSKHYFEPNTEITSVELVEEVLDVERCGFQPWTNAEPCIADRDHKGDHQYRIRCSTEVVKTRCSYVNSRGFRCILNVHAPLGNEFNHEYANI